MRVREKKKETMRGEKKKKKGNDTSLRDLRRTGGRNASGQETKLVHVMKATRGYRNPSFSSKLQKVGVFSYTGSSLFKSCKWSCGLAQTRDWILGHWDYFSNSPGLGFKGQYPSRFWFRDS